MSTKDKELGGFTWATYISYLTHAKSTLTDAQRLTLTLFLSDFECVEAQNARQYYEAGCVMARVAATAAPSPPSEEENAVVDS